MPQSPKLLKGRVFEGSGFTVLSREVENDGTDLLQADLTSIAWATYERCADDPEAVIGSGTLTVSNVVFDTLQTSDGRWDYTKDAAGFNFAFEFPASAFPNGGSRYLLEITFTPSSGEVWKTIAEVDVIEVEPA